MKNHSSFVVWLAAAVLGSACGEVSSNKKVDAAVQNDAAIDAPPECPVGTTALCSGNGLVTCDGEGNITNTETCALGCNATETRCNKVDPSNGLAAMLDEAAASTDLLLSGATTINTDAGTIVDQTGMRTPLTSQVNGSPIGSLVIKVKSFTTGGNISVEGTRALVILSGEDVVINHDINVSARLDVNGPGAITNNASCRGGAPAANNADGGAGGGGGGFGTAGGTGGTGGIPVIAGGTAGMIAGNPELVPLRGGCPGGVSSYNSGGSHAPGAGGGAIQIVSGTRISVGDNAAILANGSGARGPASVFCVVDTPCGNGYGGGAGGGVLLEAPVVTLAATAGIFANGGGGKCGVSGSGQAGQRSTTPATGQTCSGDTGSAGNGAAGATGATNGGNGLNDDPVGGGGGGGMGRIRVNLPLGMTFVPAGTVSGVQSQGALQVR